MALSGDYIEVFIPRPNRDITSREELSLFHMVIGEIVHNQLKNQKGEPVVVRWKED